MDILDHNSNAPGIKGNASLEEILSFWGYNDLLRFAESKAMSQSNINFIVGTDPDIRESMKVERLKGLEIDTLRHLKSSIANQFCISNFETFLSECNELGEDEIPLIQKDESDIWSLGAVKTLDFTNLEGDRIIDVSERLGMTQPRYDKYSHLEVFGEQYSKYIEINNAIVLFNRSLTEYFKKLGCELYDVTSDKEIMDLMTVHSLIEEYLSKVNKRLYGKTRIEGINLNTNGCNLGEYLEQRVERELEMPSLEEIGMFLSRQTKKLMQYTAHRRNATLHNNNMYYFDTNERIFMLLERTPLPSDIENVPGIGGCPFAKVKISTGQNALKKMFDFTDECHMKILSAFKEQGYID